MTMKHFEMTRPPVRRLALLLASSPLLASATAAQAAGAPPGPTPGDLYLRWSGLPSHEGPTVGLMRIDPLTWQSETIFSLPQSEGIASDGAYEPHRDRVLVHGTFVDSILRIWAVDGEGGAEPLEGSGVAVGICATGDGRIYFQDSILPNWIVWLDADDQAFLLNDEAGEPFQFSSADNAIVGAMAYESTNNALYMAMNTFQAFPPPGDMSRLQLLRIPLSADGSYVDGAVRKVDVQVDPLAEFHIGSSWSHLPDGDLLLGIATGVPHLSPRLQRVDPATLKLSTFASTSGFVDGVAYSHVLDRAVVVDARRGVLRVFDEGDAGAGEATALPGIQAEAGEVPSIDLVEIWP